MDVLSFRVLLWLGRPALRASLGPSEARRVETEAIAKFRALRPEIPQLGKAGAHSFLVVTAMLVAMRRACPERSPHDAAVLVGDICRSGARFLPGPVRRFYRWVFFSPWYHRSLVTAVVGGGEAGFEGKLVEHPGGFGVDYSRCALQHFLQRVGEPELGPEICGLDDIESEIFGLGL